MLAVSPLHGLRSRGDLMWGKVIKLKRTKFILVVFLLSVSGLGHSGETVVRYLTHEEFNVEENTYYKKLLLLALNKTKNDGDSVRLQPVRKDMLQARSIQAIANSGQVDLMWTMTSIEREETLLPVRIPLLKGLIGSRVLLIRPSDQVFFNNITSLAQLQGVLAGQGHDWPDVSILRANNLPVITSSSYLGLFEMLKKGRFDYFPRGVSEIGIEFSKGLYQGLVVESSILLQYPTAFYFFVHPDNTALAERLERGLRLAIADGSFDIIFRRHLATTTTIAFHQLHRRRIFKLHNPLLPQLTPINEPALWFQFVDNGEKPE